MKYLLLLAIIPFLSNSECGKKKKEQDQSVSKEEVTQADQEQGKPGPVGSENLLPCLKKIIDDANKSMPSEGPLQVDQYLYNGKTYYLFKAPCCDQFNTLYDDSCKAVCSPTGGFSGRGDGNCPDFLKTAKLIKVVYTKPEDK